MTPPLNAYAYESFSSGVELPKTRDHKRGATSCALLEGFIWDNIGMVTRFHSAVPAERDAPKRFGIDLNWSWKDSDIRRHPVFSLPYALLVAVLTIAHLTATTAC